MSEAGQGRRAASAIDALRRGWSVRVTGGDGGGYVVRAVETLFEGGIGADACLLISAERAETLKITNQRAAAQASLPVLIRTPEPLTPVSALAVADPALDLANPFKGPFTALPLDHPAAAAGAIDLTRFAGLLPAVLIEPDGTADVDTTKADIAAYRDPGSLRIAARAALPVADAPDSQIVVFRAESDAREHVALIVGSRGNGPPLVRLHSECLTGDVFGSLKCDCGPQLDAALHAMADEAAKGGWGVLLYMRQEGRGIGIINKLRAYRLQDQGFDTVDANTRLGLPDEARDFPTAARMLELLKVEKIRLMTNNPAKVEALAAQGVAVTERVAHALPDNPHNAHYLATKRDRSGHLL